jgi:hypothetical protein
MTDFTNEEMREIILRVLDENAAHMAEKYGIPRSPKQTSDTSAEAAREPVLANAK